jgi:hypothetical protein
MYGKTEVKYIERILGKRMKLKNIFKRNKKYIQYMYIRTDSVKYPIPFSVFSEEWYEAVRPMMKFRQFIKK